MTIAQNSVQLQSHEKSRERTVAETSNFGANKTIDSPQSAYDAKKILVLLKNDQVLEGEYQSNGNIFYLTNPFGTVQFSRDDAAFAGQSLKEIYQFKKSRTPLNSSELTRLATWCVANKMKNEAAYEYDRAILWATDQVTVAFLRNEKKAAMAMFDEQTAREEAASSELKKYRDWKEEIPAATFYQFRRVAFPILIQNCGGMACHGSNSLNEFQFTGVTDTMEKNNIMDDEIALLKNMQRALRYILVDSPTESPLIRVPIVPHGRTKQIFTHRNAGQYKYLFDWATRTAAEMSAYYPLDETDRVARDSLRKQTSEQHSEQNNTVQNAQFSQINSLQASYQSPEVMIAERIASVSQTQRQTFAEPAQTPRQALPFDFFSQPTITPYGAIPANPNSPISQTFSQRRTSANVPQNQSSNAPETQNKRERFERMNLLQQLERPPIDPFDPVLFNRNYYLPKFRRSE
ncbi:MAG: hypothetical protein LBT05_10875 [Planctomycetaceae bacterium]|nr:hypothetical protein [Planctomycetaceae bacterium]